MFASREDFRAEAALHSEELLETLGVDPFDELRHVGESLVHNTSPSKRLEVVAGPAMAMYFVFAVSGIYDPCQYRGGRDGTTDRFENNNRNRE